jgi:leucyl-tRNA synthetase
MKEVDFPKIEKKWQESWEKAKIFQAKENPKKKKHYILEMFPYPSGSGLHMGHALNYTIGDVFARFKRMSGFNVLYPMGYDSLGLPAENAAIKDKTHPKKYTEASMKNFIKQQQALGLSYDWSKKIVTSEPEYYKWDQWIFLQMFKKGLAYKKKSAVNYCSQCDTVLANEQVVNGMCWRHAEQEVEIKNLEQWFFKITKYAEELNNFSKIEEWPEMIKKLQKNWIGKSHGTEIVFKINGEKWKIFTTRPDTVYGVTFMVISAQHQRLMEIVTDKEKPKVKEFLKKLKSVSEKELETLEKEGVFTGSYAEHPITKEKVPVYAGNFVLADYGSGMVMAVPAHDRRDFEFAKKYKIPIKQVINGGKIDEHAHTGPGKLINSDQFNTLDNESAKEKITKYISKEKIGKPSVQFKLRDWLISRQRYWGTPIPIIYCKDCGAVPVPEKDLPVELPEKVKFGKGNPLESAKAWQKVSCPKCGIEARRETDTMDTFVNSSWYFLRYCDSKNKKQIFDPKKANYWTPVDTYIGGKEHACMHLIYIRFYTKFLRDLGLLKIDEPAKRLFNQGFLYAEDGKKMSKSLGNVIDPIETTKKFGSDSLRLYLVSVASPDSDFSWNDKEMQGSHRFVKRFFENFPNIKIKKSSPKLQSNLNKTIKQLTEDIENFKYNIAVIKIRALFEKILEELEISKKDFESALKLLAVFCPHLCEELWKKLGNKPFISLADWPKPDEKKIDENLAKQDQFADKISEDINNIMRIVKEKQNRSPTKVFIYTIPKEKEIYEKELEAITKKTQLEVSVFAVNDKDKYDPTNKAKNSKPEKPALYLE